MNPIKELSDAIEKKGLKLTFGLEAQGHIPTIERILKKWNTHDIEDCPDMIYSRHVWEEIGKEIGWEPFAAALHYFKYLEKKNK